MSIYQTKERWCEVARIEFTKDEDCYLTVVEEISLGFRRLAGFPEIVQALPHIAEARTLDDLTIQLNGAGDCVEKIDDFSIGLSHTFAIGEVIVHVEKSPFNSRLYEFEVIVPHTEDPIITKDWTRDVYGKCIVLF